MNEEQETAPEVDPLAKTLDKIGAYSEIGFISNTETNFTSIDHLDASRKWNVVPRPLRGNHRKNGELTFSDALEAMRAGYSVELPGWRAMNKGPLQLDTKLVYSRETMGIGADRVPGFFHQGNERFRTELTEFPANYILATNWTVVGRP